MTAEPLALVLRYVRQLADAECLAALPDGWLLERYACGHDEAAFAVLVERYGGLVLGVCRRLLGNGHDAEDAFQATFLVLARRAAKLDRSGPLGGWLHTVAYRLALRARAEAHQRHKREYKAARGIEMAVATEAGAGDWRPTLDEELQRLPDKYRLPLVLCYLQGKTNAEAAVELGWSAGSMSRRLARARELLREGLVRRGVGLPAALLGVAAVSELAAAVPASLLAVTARAAVAFERGQVAVEVSAGARVLAQAYLKGTAMTKIKVLAAVVLLAGLVTGGTLAQQAPGKKQGGSQPMSESRPASDHESVPEARDRKEPVPVRLRPGDIPIGLLGDPLGDYLTIEGIREHGSKVGNQTLRVDTINGKKLHQPIDIWVENIRDLPPDVRIKLKGYETGEMVGPVPAAIKAAEDKGEEVLVPQRGWQWNAYFVALSSVNSKLTIEERRTGFKTAKPGQNPTSPREERN